MDWKKKSAAVLVAGGMFGANEAPAQPLGINQVQNNSFETVSGSNATIWTGLTETYVYSGNYTGPAPPGSGLRYWHGGTGSPNTNGNQTINLVAAGFPAALLDSGTLNYNFRAYFSGYANPQFPPPQGSSNPDYSFAVATFLDAALGTLGTRTIGGQAFVSALTAVPGRPFGGTGRTWGEDVASASLPAGTRSVRIDLNGVPATTNTNPDGYVDLVNFNLTVVPEPGTFVLLGGTGLIGLIIRVRRSRQLTPPAPA